MKKAFGFAGMMLAATVMAIGSTSIGRAADDAKDIVDTAVAAGSFNTLAAALKAMGTGTLTLTKMIMLQALMVGGIGYGLGAGIASLIGWLGRGTEQVPYLTSWPLLAVSLAATIFADRRDKPHPS
jgi:hypothetical protein